MLAATFPEPIGDLEAQLAAVRDRAHPKDAMFIAAGSPVVPLPTDLWVHARAEGVLATTNLAKFQRFMVRHLDDCAMAEILGYPEAKPDLGVDAVAVQARDASDRVITEAGASPARLNATIDALMAHVPAGGALVVLTLCDVHRRRMRLLRS